MNLANLQLFAHKKGVDNDDLTDVIEARTKTNQDRCA